jgi:hypothetical protein
MTSSPCRMGVSRSRALHVPNLERTLLSFRKMSRVNDSFIVIPIFRLTRVVKVEKYSLRWSGCMLQA